MKFKIVVQQIQNCTICSSHIALEVMDELENEIMNGIVDLVLTKALISTNQFTEILFIKIVRVLHFYLLTGNKLIFSLKSADSNGLICCVF